MENKELLEFMKVMKKTDIWKTALADYENAELFQELTSGNNISQDIESLFKLNKEKLVHSLKKKKNNLIDDEKIKPEAAEAGLIILDEIIGITSKLALEKGKVWDELIVSWRNIKENDLNYNSLEKVGVHDARYWLFNTQKTGSNYIPDSKSTSLIDEHSLMDKNYWDKLIKEKAKMAVQMLRSGENLSKNKEITFNGLLCFDGIHISSDIKPGQNSNVIFDKLEGEIARKSIRRFRGDIDEYHIRKNLRAPKNDEFLEKQIVQKETESLIIFEKKDVSLATIILLNKWLDGKKNPHIENDPTIAGIREDAKRFHDMRLERMGRGSLGWTPPFGIRITEGMSKQRNNVAFSKSLTRKESIWLIVIQYVLF